MKIKSCLVLALTTLLLTACTQTPHQSTEVDFGSKLRSMTYTQRHLLDVELNNNPTASTERRALLLKSHCDLIDRDFVHAKTTPEQCSPQADISTQVCIADFHRCVGMCPTFKENCVSCEQRAIGCLSSQESS